MGLQPAMPRVIRKHFAPDDYLTTQTMCFEMGAQDLAPTPNSYRGVVLGARRADLSNARPQVEARAHVGGPLVEVDGAVIHHEKRLRLGERQCL